MINSVCVKLDRRQALLGLTGSALLLSTLRPFASERGILASPWSQSSHSGLRLIAAGPASGKSGHYHAGIDIQLAPGFKTYWRHPGDSGVPPVFNFDGSDNLGNAEVLFPMPTRFSDGAGGSSFGYATPTILLPVSVVAKDPSKPVLLRLKADYAVCEKICIPANGEAALAMPTTPHDTSARAIKAGQDLVPDVVALNSGTSLQIVAFQKGPEPEQFMVDVRVPKELNPDLFLEGESPWFFETKAFTRKSGELGSFLVSVIERSKAADCTGAEVTLTLVAHKHAIEVRTRLDLALVTH